MKKVALHIILVFLVNMAWSQGSATRPQADSFSFARSDSAGVHTARKGNYLDSLRNERWIKKDYLPTETLKGIQTAQTMVSEAADRDLPYLKQIHLRDKSNSNWKFWYLVGLLLYIAIVRLINERNFDTAAFALFNLNGLSGVKSFKTSDFNASFLHLFLCYVFSLSFIFTLFFEQNHLFEHYYPYHIMVWIITFVLLAAYLVKFLIHLLLGFLVSDTASSVRFILSTFNVANFTGLILMLMAAFYAYIPFAQLSEALFFIIVSIFFTGVAYRILRFFWAGLSSHTLPFFYIIMYLCALEISPWLILLKILNNYLT